MKPQKTKTENQTRVYGYVRVSSIDQNEDRQVIALKEKDKPRQRPQQKRVFTG